MNEMFREPDPVRSGAEQEVYGMALQAAFPGAAARVNMSESESETACFQRSFILAASIPSIFRFALAFA